MEFPMPQQVGMLAVCRYFGWHPRDYLSLDNETAEWAHAVVSAEGDAAKQ